MQSALLLLQTCHLLLLLHLLGIEVLALEHHFVQHGALLALGFEQEVLGIEHLCLLQENLFPEVVLIPHILAGIAGATIHLLECLSRQDEDDGAMVLALSSGIAHGSLEVFAAQAQFAVELGDVSLKANDVGFQVVKFFLQLMDVRQSVA